MHYILESYICILLFVFILNTAIRNVNNARRKFVITLIQCLAVHYYITRELQIDSMNCIQPLKKTTTVHFKKDIGAELTTVPDFDTFRMDFSNILGGLIDTDMDTSICIGK